MLTFVGVGPGDPELLTLKAVHALRRAGAIAYVDAGTGKNTALDIVKEYVEGKPRLQLKLPMRGERDSWRAAHEAAANALLELTAEYGDVAVPVLGDPGIYATAGYLMRQIAQRHPCAVIPGIPSFTAAAAANGVPLCEQGERLTVCDGFTEGDQLPPGNVALMKCGRQLDNIKELAAGREVYIARNLGLPGEWTGKLCDAPDDMAYSYFTTAIIKP